MFFLLIPKETFATLEIIKFAAFVHLMLGFEGVRASRMQGLGLRILEMVLECNDKASDLRFNFSERACFGAM